MGIWSKTMFVKGIKIRRCGTPKDNGSTFKTLGVDVAPGRDYGAKVTFDDHKITNIKRS